MAQANDKLTTEIRRLPLKQLRHLETNARYMTSDQQKRLTANVQRDGGLTSLPLVWLMQDEKGKPLDKPERFEIVSGNHRVTSARDAGLEEIDCIVILNWISPQRRVEIQLAHNAVSGQDDLSVLEGLYEGLSLDGKEYSGLTDGLFSSLQDLALETFNVAAPDYQEITLSFLPGDREQFEDLLKRAAKREKATFHAAHIDDFDALFDAIVQVKERDNILNSAVAIHVVAELALERLAQLQGEAEQENEAETDVVE